MAVFFFFLMCDWCCPLTQAIRKGVCLNHCYAGGASTRSESQRLRNFGAYKDFVKEWRSGFNRYRRTWAGPKMTTEIGAFLAPGRGSKERHSFPYFFLSLSRMSQIVGAGGAYASHYQYITRSHDEGGWARAASLRCTSHVRSTISLLSAWSPNGPWDNRRCGGYTKKGFHGRNNM